MSIRIRVLIGLALLALLDVRDLHGAVGIAPHFEKDAIPRRIVGVRYSMRIDHLNADTNIVLVFGHIRLWNHARPQKTHLLELNGYSYWVKYNDTGSAPWPPGNNGESFHGQGGLWVSVSDYNKEGFVGIQHATDRTRRMFPRINTGIDNIAGITKIETIAQQNMLGKEIHLEVIKGATHTIDVPQDDWGGRYRLEKDKQVSLEKLPAGTYQLWNVRAVFDGYEYYWKAAYPADQARYIAPHQIIHFVTEFFEMKTKVRMSIWNPQYRREGQTEWQGIHRWNRFYQAGADPYGPRIAEVDGRHVMEFSNDKPAANYPKKGDFLDLKMNPSVQWKSVNSAAALDQKTVRVTAIIDRPMTQPVKLLVRSGGTAVRGVDFMLDEIATVEIPAGQSSADLDIPVRANPSRKKGARVILTFVGSGPAAMAGNTTHVLTLEPGK